MIFVTLGSQKFQFNRLLKAIDALCEQGTIKESVFAQTGYSDYKPVHYEYKQFLDRELFAEMMNRCDIVITHGGTGAIIGAVKKGRKVIAVPRLAQYGEHVDDHQTQLTSQFRDLGMICECLDVEKLGEALMKVRETEYKEYRGSTQAIIDSVESFIEGRKQRL